MGAKTWMLVYAESNARQVLSAKPLLDREATFKLARKLFAKDHLEPLPDGDLSYTCPPENELHIGCFAGVSVIAAREFQIDLPSKLLQEFIEAGGSGTIYFHAMHSVVDWFAFAIWSNGALVRSLSLSPDSGILEDIGPKCAFEVPFWSGEHPLREDDDEEEEAAYPFPFHPLEMGEAALTEFFGYSIEGMPDRSSIDAESIPLMRFKRSRSWWKFW